MSGPQSGVSGTGAAGIVVKQGSGLIGVSAACSAGQLLLIALSASNKFIARARSESWIRAGRRIRS